MEKTLNQFVLVERDKYEQIISIKGVYTYKEALNILENGHKKLGGKLYVPEGNADWAIEWHYEDYNETYWGLLPINNDFKYPKYLE